MNSNLTRSWTRLRAQVLCESFLLQPLASGALESCLSRSVRMHRHHLALTAAYLAVRPQQRDSYLEASDPAILALAEGKWYIPPQLPPEQRAPKPRRSSLEASTGMLLLLPGSRISPL